MGKEEIDHGVVWTGVGLLRVRPSSEGINTHGLPLSSQDQEKGTTNTSSLRQASGSSSVNGVTTSCGAGEVVSGEDDSALQPGRCCPGPCSFLSRQDLDSAR